jgi:nickel superoxide dismutase
MKSTILLSAVMLVTIPDAALAHCEIPCGIYGDDLRILMLKEHLQTVEKSMREIDRIGSGRDPNWNQLTRWVTNKEKHAGEIQHIVTQYFMTQRVKLPSGSSKSTLAKYNKQLTLLHQLLVSAMKMKQTTDISQVSMARALVDDFAAAYFSPADLEHLKKHK